MSKIQIGLHEPPQITLKDLEKEAPLQDDGDIYRPFIIEGLQSYNPVYSQFFELTENKPVALNHRYHITDLKHVKDRTTGEIVEREPFIKFAPLLDPIRYLIGKYNTDENIRLLPSIHGNTHPKLESPHNSSYVDNFFCYLSSQLLNEHQFIHSVDYYGSYLGVQEKYKMNLADDIDYLQESDFFNRGNGILFDVEKKENPLLNFGSRNHKNKLAIHNDSNITSISLEEVEEGLDGIGPDAIELVEGECVFERSSLQSSDGSENSDINYSEDSSSELEDSEDSEDEAEDDSDSDIESDESDSSDEVEEEDEVLNGYIHNFPVQMIFLEKCTGTLDQLFVKKLLDLDGIASCLFQVIMILITYQKIFHFTHNDLHTNNIMYVETEVEFLYYKYAGKYYKVPTYGKIFKIIDFGRAIYKIHGKTFCSDSFGPGGDASTQYNFEPFLNKKKARIEPNYSFDLCRLGCSIYDFILDINEELDTSFTPDAFQSLIIHWVKDDHGKNVIYKKSGEERYPNFKLYKMIARTVHDKTPESQLENPFFQPFHVDSVDSAEVVIDIDSLPCYA